MASTSSSSKPLEGGGSSPAGSSMSRKRSQQGHASDNESNSNSARAKKRSKPNGTSHLAHNNADSEASDSEPFSQLIGLEGLDLELFKKEALYRQLLEYRRQLEHAQDQCLALTSEVDRLRSAEAAVRTSWQSISPSLALDSFPSFSDFDSTSDYAAALERLASEQSALLRQSSSSEQQQQPNGSDSEQQQVHRLTAESVANKQALALTQAQLHSVKAQLESMQDKWARAEKRADRSLSSTVAILEKRPLPQSQPSLPPPDSHAQPSSSSASSHPLPPSTTSADQPRPQPMDVDPAAQQQSQQQQQQEVSSLYEAEERLRLLSAQRQTEIDQLKLALQYPTDEAVRKSPAYAALQSELDSSKKDVDTALRQLESLQSELDTLKEAQASWRDALLRDHAVSDEMERRHVEREKDLARIRLQREELKAENGELKLREQEKHKSMDQVRELANSKEDRITAFKSEVRRLRMSVAASKGDTEGVELEQSEFEDQVKTLREQLQSATDLAFGLRDQLKSYSTNAGSASALVESETNIRQELVKTKKRLDHFESILAVSPEHPDGDAAAVSRKAVEQEERIKVLEAQVKSAESSSAMLITEVDRLSSAWQTLDVQNRDKVLNLIQHEEKVGRILSEKAKADNRYFAAMRAKEALAAENLVLNKTSDKQSKAIAACEEAAKAQAEHIKTTEQEVAKQNERAAECSRQLDSMTTQRDALLAERDVTAQRIIDLQGQFGEQGHETERISNEKRRLEDQVQQLERRISKFEAAESASKGSKDKTAQVEELERFNDDLTKMLKCTSCKTRFKSHVITRCYHLLCHECIEARLSHRQRKCPTCQMAFGQADVAQVYF